MKENVVEFLKGEDNNSITNYINMSYLITSKSANALLNCVMIIFFMSTLLVSILTSIVGGKININEMMLNKDINFIFLIIIIIGIPTIVILRQCIFIKRFNNKVKKSLFCDMKFYYYQIFVNDNYHGMVEFVRDKVSKEDVFKALKNNFDYVDYDDVKSMRYERSKGTEFLVMIIKYRYNDAIVKKKRKLSNDDFRIILESNFDKWLIKSRDSYRQEEVLNKEKIKKDYNYFIINFTLYLLFALLSLIYFLCNGTDSYWIFTLSTIYMCIIVLPILFKYVRTFKQYL